MQVGARFLKVSECFVTGRGEWSNTGGLIGMILTLADSNASSQASMVEEASRKAHSKARQLGHQGDAEKLRQLEAEILGDLKNNTMTLFGPRNLKYTLATARRFVFRKGMPIDVHEIHEDESTTAEEEGDRAPYYADENIKVWAMSISPTPHSPPTTPKKRSIDEVYGSGVSTNENSTDGITSEPRDCNVVETIVGEMFNSSWSLDKLYETRLAQVKLPATIFIKHDKTNKIEKYRGPLPGGVTPLPDPDLKVFVRRPWPGALIETLPKTKPAIESISYIIRNHKQRGKFNPEAAVELKIEKGKLWSQLTNGNSVVNAEGETITPEMVLGPAKEGGGVAVVDLPDSSYIEPLINRPEWRDDKIMTGVGAIVWICGKDVATDSRVHAFMRKFSHLHHLVSSPDYCPNELALDSVAAATTRLRGIDPDRYKVPVHDVQDSGVGQVYGGSDSFLNTRLKWPLPKERTQVAKRGQIIQLEPIFELRNTDIVPPLDIAGVDKQLSRQVLNEAALAQEVVKSSSHQHVDWQSTIPDPETEIITLGTGSALPSKYRNVSATLVRVPGWGCLLFDCGENTLGQLKRVFTPAEFKQVLQELRLIFISHMHADHHLGTASVIKAWYEEVHESQPAPAIPAVASKRDVLSEPERRLAVISEPAMLHWLSEYSSVEDYGFSRLAPLVVSPARPQKDVGSKLSWFVDRSSLLHSSYAAGDLEKADANIVPPSALGLSDVQAVLVRHCHGARAVSITLPSGFKASYSGDCRPSKEFSQVGKGSTVCIHEATFDDELQGDAEAKNHSTTSEALGVAQAMDAKACILTHFSQRYQKIPVLERGHGNLVEDEVAVEEPEDAVEDDEAEMSGPLEDDIAPTLPDQTVNGSLVDEGQKYDLPAKVSKRAAHSSTSSGPPAAVKFKLKSDMKVCVAFDYMRVKVKDMWQMEKFTPALLELFAEEDKSEKASEAGSDPQGKAKAKGKGNKQKQKQKQKKEQKKGSVGDTAKSQPKEAKEDQVDYLHDREQVCKR
jgi:ribonuclease Z